MRIVATGRGGAPCCTGTGAVAADAAAPQSTALEPVRRRHFVLRVSHPDYGFSAGAFIRCDVVAEFFLLFYRTYERLDPLAMIER
jgi:hypothetical protein